MVRYLYMSIRHTGLVVQNPDHSITLVLVVYSNLPRQIVGSLHVSVVLVLLVHSLEPTGSVRLHKVQYLVLEIPLLHLVVQKYRLLLRLQIALYCLMLMVIVMRTLFGRHQILRHYSDLLDLYLISVLLVVVEISLIQYYLMLVVGQRRLLLRRQMEISTSSISQEEWNRVFLFTLLIGSLQKAISRQQNWIGVLLLQPQLNHRKIGMLSSPTTRLFRRKQRTGDSYFQTSTGLNLAVNIIQIGIPSLQGIPLGQDRPENLQELQPLCYRKIPILHLHFLTSLLENLVLLHTMLVYSSLENSGYHRHLNTQYSVKKASLPSRVLVMSRLLLPQNLDLDHSSLLVDTQNLSPRHTYKEITPILVVLQVRSSVLILITQLRLLLGQEESLVRHTHELLILQRMSLVEILMFVVAPSRLPIPTLTMSLQSSMVRKMRIGEHLIMIQVTDLDLILLVLLLVLRHLTMKAIHTTKIKYSPVEV